MSYKPISDYGIIGNMLTATLVGKEGSIDWCCLPRFASPSAFAAILDDERGGQFTIKPELPFESRQSYLPDTNVLQTTFKTDTGRVTVTDFMPCYPNPRGGLVKLNEIHRLVDCSQGEVSLESIFAPKLDYARGTTSLEISKRGVTAKKVTETLVLSSAIPFAMSAEQAMAQFTLRQGDKAVFVLSYGLHEPHSVTIHNSAQKLEKTTAYWKQKAKDCIFSGPWREPVVRSYLTLHLMVYSPTGAIVAAPTTSLPEEIGGERNWDYRYTWLRDASLTLNAFSFLGHKEEAVGFMRWLLSICDRCGPKAQILYAIDVGDSLDERILGHLKGYRESRPVRVGNGAYHQRQLDVFGELLEAAYNYAKIGGYIGKRDWELLETFIDAACELWQEPDSGIWEIRGGPFHFVHSKLMCWVAVDRGIKLAESLGHGGKLEYWRKTAQEIRDDILSRGWNSQRQAFTQHYDTQALDASNLLMPLFGFLSISDERIKATIDRTVAELSWNGPFAQV